MKALWHLIYWPALLLVGIAFLVAGLVSFVQFLLSALAQHAEKKLRK